MSRQTVLARGRAAAAAGFVDTCKIERPGAPVTSTVDGTVTTPMTVVYPAQPGSVAGPCRIQQAAAPWAGPATVGQAGIGLSALEIQLPVLTSKGITKDDIVTVTACVHDADLVGKKFTVQGAHRATHKTTRRLPLMEILG